MPSAPATHFTRSANACDACRQRKVKCSGSRPCTACVRRGIDCEFGFVGRRGYSEAYVQKLMETIKTQDEQLKQPAEGEKSSQASGSPAHRPTPPDTDIPDAPDPQAQDPPSPVTELTTGPAFETRVRSIMREHAGAKSPGTSPKSIFTFESPKAAIDNQWPSPRSALITSTSAVDLPPQEEAYRLFETFTSWMGTNQHYLDSRSFVDSMDMLYQDETGRTAQMQTLWFSQFLLVMAIGKLIGYTSGSPNDPTIEMYFLEARRRLPPMDELGSYGVVSVEIMCLASIYLQWNDRKHDAYLYTGSAIRLAFALGCALPMNEQQGLSSEKRHRTRVFWSSYTQDRRLSAALGLPPGAEDRQIRADLPEPAPGFADPAPMIMNVQIARATGDIMSTIYASTSISQGKLVKSIQSTLQKLYETQKSIPSQLSIDFDKPRVTVTRTSASLYLALFQAIFLLIRPMLLQRVKDKIRCLKANMSQPSRSTAMARLCHSCRDAARKTIRILTALQEDDKTLFGTFDLDATFSAAFVLVMKGFLESNDLQRPPVGLREAAEILGQLSKAGNKIAQRRLEELKQFCYNIWSPDSMSQEWGWLREDATSQMAIDPGLSLPSEPGLTDFSTGSDTQTPSTAGDVSGIPVWGNWDANNADFVDFEKFQMDLNMEMGDIYDCYNDPALPLTGIDEVDWAEAGKMFSFNEIQ